MTMLCRIFGLIENSSVLLKKQWGTVMVDEEKFFTKCNRAFRILIHRYLIFSFIAFIVASKLVFAETEQDLFVLLCAVAVLGFVIVFFGRRGAMYSYFIGLGFLASVTCNVMGWVAFFIEIPLFLAISMYLVTDERNNDRKLKKEIMSKFMTANDLYAERKESFDAILKYISNHSVIGIDSPYGNGKSSVVEALRCEKDDWEFITIGILSTTLENVEFCIIREINRVLESYGVFSNPISKVKSFFSHDFAYCVGDFLFESQSYEEQMRNYVDDIQKIGKVIVLNFEDIDRITNIEHLNKIFAICDTLLKIEAKREPEERFIKVIYQYSAKILDKLFMENYGDERYTEKYIPHSVSLPVLTGEFFKKVLEKNLEKYDEIRDYKFDFLGNPYEQILLQQTNLRLDLEKITVRAIEQVLDKVNSAFKLYGVKKSDTMFFETAVIFNITKYFFPDIYKVLKKGESMDDQKLFHYFERDGSESIFSLKGVRKKITENRTAPALFIEKFFDEKVNKKAQDNKNALIILSLLGYDDDYYGYDGYKTDEDLGEIPEERLDRMAEKNRIFLKLMDLH